MTIVRKYDDLKVWQKAMDIVESIYSVTKAFPKEEIYGLTMQIRRSAVSIPSNIAEGFGRMSLREFARYIDISYGSLSELETQLKISTRLGFISEKDEEVLLKNCSELSWMMLALKNKIKKQPSDFALRTSD